MEIHGHISCLKSISCWELKIPEMLKATHFWPITHNMYIYIYNNMLPHQISYCAHLCAVHHLASWKLFPWSRFGPSKQAKLSLPASSFRRATELCCLHIGWNIRSFGAQSIICCLRFKFTDRTNNPWNLKSSSHGNSNCIHTWHTNWYQFYTGKNTLHCPSILR